MFFSSLKNFNSLNIFKRFLRNNQRQRSLLDEYAHIYRPEIESQIEYLAVQTSRKKSLQIDYEIEQQRRRQHIIRYHILRRKYVAHPNDIQVDPYVKNHMQFLYKNYPKRWNVHMLAESFNQSVENVRLILQQRTRRGMRVRARSPATTFSIHDEDEKERLVREHILKRDLSSKDENYEEPVDHQILAEESHLVQKQCPSQEYLKRDNDGFFSNVIASSNEDQQNEHDLSTKEKLLTSSSALTLLDRINKLRLNPTPSFDTSSNDQISDELIDQRMIIMKKMQQINDSIVENNERKQKYKRKV